VLNTAALKREEPSLGTWERVWAGYEKEGNNGNEAQ
jgi:hypothetical protein